MSNQFVGSMGVIGFADDNPLGEARQRKEILSAQLHVLDNVSELFEIVRNAAFPVKHGKRFATPGRMTELQAQVIIECKYKDLLKWNTCSSAMS